MAVCERLAGITGLSIDGDAYMVVSDVTWSPSNVARTTLVGLDAVHGFEEKPIFGFIEATLRDSGNMSVKDFQRNGVRRGAGDARQRQAGLAAPRCGR